MKLKPAEILQKIREYHAHETYLISKGYPGNPQNEIADIMQVSVKEAYRYQYGSRLILELQDMIGEGIIGLSSLQSTATKPINVQYDLYRLYLQALAQAKHLALKKKILDRNNCIIIVNQYLAGNRNMDTIWPHLITTTPKESSRHANNSPSTTKDFANITLDNIKTCTTQIEKGTKFVEFVFARLIKQGFSCEIVRQQSCDNGADIIAVKQGVRYAIQCKYKGNNALVSKKAVTEVIKAQKHYGCHVGVVVSNGKYSKAAISSAAENKPIILLWDTNKLDMMD